MPRAAVADAPATSREARIRDLGQSFRHAFRALRKLRGRDTHLVAGEIGHAQLELLSELFERGPQAACELADAAGLSAASVSQMLDHLADEDLVERVRSETDRRVVVTKLTRRGRRRIEARREQWRERWEHALADIPDEDLAVAGRVLRKIGTVFEDPPA